MTRGSLCPRHDKPQTVGIKTFLLTSLVFFANFSFRIPTRIPLNLVTVEPPQHRYRGRQALSLMVTMKTAHWVALLLKQ